MTAHPAPTRRVGRPSNLARLGVAVDPPPAPIDTGSVLTELSRVLHAVSQALSAASTELAHLSVAAPPPAATAPTDVWLTLGEASAVAKVSRDTMTRWIKQGRVAVIRDVDGQPYRPYRVRRADLEWL